MAEGRPDMARPRVTERSPPVDRPRVTEGSPDVDRDEIIESLWYKALLEEDCLAVMGLLKDHPRLVRVGWEEDRSISVEGSPRNHWEPLQRRLWMGRTALHVGASRGCTELVKQVLILCGVNITPVLSVLNPGQGARTSSPTEDTEIVIDPPRKSDEQIMQKTTNNVIDHWKAQVQNDEARLAEGAIVRWKRKLIMRKGSGVHESATGSDSQKPQPSGVGENRDRDRYSFSPSDLMSLFCSKDGEYDLRALDMTSFHGNRDVMALLQYAVGPDPNSLLRINMIGEFGRDFDRDKTYRSHLREVTAEVIATFSDDPTFRTSCLDEYAKHRDFNFLPREEYLFHFLFTHRFQSTAPGGLCDRLQNTLWKKVRSSDDHLWRFLLQLEDGHGRPPCHVVIMESWLEHFMDVIRDGGAEEREVLRCALTNCDGAGRTPLFRACAVGELQVVDVILGSAEDYEVRAELQLPCTYSPLLQDERANSFRSRPMLEMCSGTPLHVAIIHRETTCVRLLLRSMPRWLRDKEAFYPCNWDAIVTRRPEIWGRADAVELNDLELALLVGEEKIVDRLLSQGPDLLRYQAFSSRGYNSGKMMVVQHPWQALHIAASSGSYTLLRKLLENPNCDPFSTDFEGSTALHHALQADVFQFDIGVHYLNYVSCQHFLSKALPKANEKRLKDIQGCVDLLLLSGCDMFRGNEKMQIPYPEGKNAELLSWWSKKQTAEFGAIQDSLNAAANIISVTAALVATASFVGPLQPPLGYGSKDSTNQIQYDNFWVATFILCDSISFYLAIAAIIISLVPSLPMPQQSILSQIKSTRTVYTLGVALVFPSIIFVLLAFVSSTMAVVSVNITSAIGGKLTIASLVICGPLILVASFVFYIRLLGMVYPRNTWIKYMYKSTSFE